MIAGHAPDGPHIWPGGRRIAGESYRATARREVYEETGRTIEENLMRPLAFLHFRSGSCTSATLRRPHPDFLQIVYAARIDDDGETAEQGWTDLDG